MEKTFSSHLHNYWIEFLQNRNKDNSETVLKTRSNGKLTFSENLQQFFQERESVTKNLGVIVQNNKTLEKITTNDEDSTIHGEDESDGPLDLSKSHQNEDKSILHKNVESEMIGVPIQSNHPFVINNLLGQIKPMESSINQSQLLLIPLKDPTPLVFSPTSTTKIYKSSTTTTTTFSRIQNKISKNELKSVNIPETLSILRPILRTRGKERSLLPCSVCGKSFDRPSLLKRHMRTHTGEKPHICDVCSKGFSTSSSLNTHRRIHSGEKPHQCPICGKRFTASSNLYYHRMTHNKEKPHKCLLCGKSFPTPGDLKSHQYVHSGTWPHNCPICHRGFSKQTNLRNHLLLHSGDKPHCCAKCGKKFALACNLRAHYRTHDEDQLLSTRTCVTCEKPCPSLFQSTASKGVCKSCLTVISEKAKINTSSSKNMQPLLSIGFPQFQPPRYQNLKNQETITSHQESTSGVLSTQTQFQYPGHRPQEFTTIPHPNPFLEHLLAWNWQFTHQKLIESQVLATHLISTRNSSHSSNIRYSSDYNNPLSFTTPYFLPIPNGQVDWSQRVVNKTER